MRKQTADILFCGGHGQSGSWRWKRRAPRITVQSTGYWYHIHQRPCLKCRAKRGREDRTIIHRYRASEDLEHAVPRHATGRLAMRLGRRGRWSLITEQMVSGRPQTANRRPQRKVVLILVFVFYVSGRLAPWQRARPPGDDNSLHERINDAFRRVPSMILWSFEISGGVGSSVGAWRTRAGVYLSVN